MRFLLFALILAVLATFFLSACASCSSTPDYAGFYYDRHIQECRADYIDRHLNDLNHAEEDSLVYCLEIE